jgi:hypothetical protein
MTIDEIKTMSAAKLAKHLLEHNKWRRGIGKYGKAGAKSPHTPYELGAIIDRAVELLNGQKSKIEQIKLDILHLIDSEYDLAHGSEIRKVLKEVRNG